MGFFDFFTKKKPEVIEEVVQEEPQPNGIIKEGCGYCGNPITKNDKVRKFSKKIYHRKCFKKLKKDATKVAFG